MITKAQVIEGWMSDTELNWLANAAKNAKVIIEFGCYLGRSTRALADNCPGVVYAVDPWNGVYHNNDNTIAKWLNTNVFDVFCYNLDDHIKSGKVIPIKDFSWAFHEPVKADLIFIDGDHRYEEVKIDITIATRFINPDGIIAGHDYSHGTWPGVKQAVDEMLGNVSHCDSIWWTRFK